jgi:hypothetical protein
MCRSAGPVRLHVLPRDQWPLLVRHFQAKEEPPTIAAHAPDPAAAAAAATAERGKSLLFVCLRVRARLRAATLAPRACASRPRGGAQRSNAPKLRGRRRRAEPGFYSGVLGPHTTATNARADVHQTPPRSTTIVIMRISRFRSAHRPSDYFAGVLGIRLVSSSFNSVTYKNMEAASPPPNYRLPTIDRSHLIMNLIHLLREAIVLL